LLSPESDRGMSLIEDLTKGFNAVVSHYMSIKIRLLLEVVESKGRQYIAVLDPGGSLAQYARELSQLITPAASQVGQDGGSLLVVFEPTPSIDLRGLADNYSNILVFTTPGSRVKIPLFFKRIYISRINQETYLVRIKPGNKTLRLITGPGGIRVVDKPLGIHGEAYSIVARLMAEYGEILVKDAVRALMLELGVDKETARRILYKLIEEKYLRVVNGRISMY